MKTSIINTINVLIALVIFTPYVYTQTASKVSCKNDTEKIISIHAASEKTSEYVYSINRR